MEENLLKETTKNEVDYIIQTKLTNEFMESYIKIGEDETYLPIYYEKYADSIKNFPVKNDDIIVSSFPKAGTTWVQEMVWMISNNCDFEGGKVDLCERFPFLEYCGLFDVKRLHLAMAMESPNYVKESVEFAKAQGSPRFIKTHLPFSLLPDEIQQKKKSPKIIYVIRNPKDVCVSYFHHGNILQGWTADFESFAKVFLSNKLMYGSFWKHVLGYWKQKNLRNLLIITYEDMKKHLPTVITKVATFLDKTLTQQQMDFLVKHLSFESMKSNTSLNYEDVVELRKQKNITNEDTTFIRTGIVGKYKEEMSPELIRRFDVWTKKHVFGTGFEKEFSYVL